MIFKSSAIVVHNTVILHSSIETFLTSKKIEKQVKIYWISPQSDSFPFLHAGTEGK